MPDRGVDGFTLAPGVVMDSVRAGQLGSLFGCEVIENPRMRPSEVVFLPGRRMMVADTWRSIRLPAMLADMRSQVRASLAEAVAAAERRLGLGPCPHLRVAVRRREAMFRDEVVCSVCGELRGWLNDEETYRSLQAMVTYA